MVLAFRESVVATVLTRAPVLLFGKVAPVVFAVLKRLPDFCCCGSCWCAWPLIFLARQLLKTDSIRSLLLQQARILFTMVCHSDLGSKVVAHGSFDLCAVLFIHTNFFLN